MEKFFLHRLQLYRLVKKPRDEYSVRWASRLIRMKDVRPALTGLSEIRRQLGSR